METYLGGVTGTSAVVTDPTRTYTVTYQVGATKYVATCFGAAIDASASTLTWLDQGAPEYRVERIETDGTATDLGPVVGTTLAITDPTRRHRISYVAAGKTYTTTVSPI